MLQGQRECNLLNLRFRYKLFLGVFFIDTAETRLNIWRGKRADDHDARMIAPRLRPAPFD